MVRGTFLLATLLIAGSGLFFLDHDLQGSAPEPPVLASGLLFLAAVAALLWSHLKATGSARNSNAELRTRLAQQEIVVRLGQLALADRPTQQLLEDATDAVASGLGVDYCGIVARGADGSPLSVRSGIGWSAEDSIPTGRGSQAGYTLEVGRPVILEDAASERRFELSPAMRRLGLSSGISAPIGSNGSQFGVIGAHSVKRRDFSAQDVSFLQAVGNVLSSALRRREAEAEVERSAALFEAVIEGTTDSVFVQDTEGRYLAANAACAAQFGLASEAVVGRTVLELFPAATAEALAAADERILAESVPQTVEERIVVRGETRVMLSTKGPYRGRDGSILGLFGIARDITDRVHQAEALARSEERLRLAQQGALMGTWEIDLDHGTAEWSDELRALLGVDADYVPSEDSIELVHAEDRERVRTAVREATLAGTDLELEYRIARPDGGVCCLLTRSIEHVGSGGSRRRLGVAVDVTDRTRVEAERDQMEARLHQAEKVEAIGQLAGGVAHDFNNLLVGIRGHGEFALRRLAAGESGAEDDIGEILTASDRASALTRQLLAFGRRQVLRPEVLDLNDVVSGITGLLGRVLGDHVELVARLAADPVRVEADRGQLEQVITNLAVNARDAMPGGGTVTIAVRTALADTRDDACAVMSVSDTGEGIDADTLSHIFEPFFTTKGAEGTGLGLATVDGIVSQSGGRILVDTEIGAGTTLSVCLPLTRNRLPAEVGPAHEPREVSGRETILVIEDDEVVRGVVCSMLGQHGYSTLEAAGGDEAIALVRAEARPIALAVSDLNMRGLDGTQTISSIRALRPGLRAIYMSGYAEDQRIRTGVLEPGTSYIQKPFSSHDLAREVRLLLAG